MVLVWHLRYTQLDDTHLSPLLPSQDPPKMMEGRKRRSLEEDIVSQGQKRIRLQEPDVIQQVRKQEIEVLQTFDFNNIYENVEFTKVMTLDQYRKCRPYKVFHYPGRSKGEIVFHLSCDGSFELTAINVCLTHCATNCHGVVDMYVNGQPFLLGYRNANALDFEEQVFRIPPSLCIAGVNVFSIVLNESSPGVYWLSDARVAIEKLM
ncbi:uncharacterized protein LOC117323759 isoform X1 [Pecten maximus]|uniref:uncharacterized protein LOC117323759 isoform X1 n=2 Tax=Pecten maximus TaxID=6579 RepID=UPI001458B44A|nr:uncharacterized protein LOC117323759 isoform X1 [Pecten maximus]